MVDISMNNPEIEKMAILIHFKVETAKMAADAFCSGNNPQSEKYSPIYGEIMGLPELSLFIGTHDILYPDCKDLRICVKIKTFLKVFEYPKMIHVWMLFHLPESKMAMKDLFSIIE